MKQAIRALRWATTVLWILVILFSGTVVYSAIHVGIEPGEPQEPFVSNGTVIIPVSFTINNMGFYDISNFEIATHIVDKDGRAISSSTSQPYLILKGSARTIPHSISINLNEITADTLTYMLTDDTVLNIDMRIALTYAHAISLRILFNTTMDWGAPLYNLTVGGIPDVSLNQLNVSLRFENRAFFDLDGTITLEAYKIVDGVYHQVGSSPPTNISVPHEPPGNSYNNVIPVTVTGDPGDVSEVRLYFDTSLFSYGPVVTAV